MTEETDIIFQDAIDALRDGDRARARDLLTRLLKADNNNATYWVWMSGAVETPKERIFCLKTALELDPENAMAKRGLVLHGALPPDENVKPFRLDRPRVWEDKLMLAHETPARRSWHTNLLNPIAKLAGVVLIGVLLIGLTVAGFSSLRPAHDVGGEVDTPTPMVSFTFTPTFVKTPSAVPVTISGPTPLAFLLGISYTPTPLYVNTPRSPLSLDANQIAKAAYQSGNWDQFIASMNEIATVEPNSADVPFYIGEAYRFKDECQTALAYYSESVKLNPQFAPGYLGLARARICMDSGADTSQLYGLALQSDPNYGEAYLDRANFNLLRKDFNSALPDLTKAGSLMPDSALVQLALAQAYLLGGDNVNALAAAQKANSIDLTLLPAYYYLGSAYLANRQYPEAAKSLQTYLVYRSTDATAWAQLGEAFTNAGNYPSAMDALNKAMDLDPNQVGSLVFLGISNLRSNNLDGAQRDFTKALEFFPDSFDAYIGLTEIYYRHGTFGTAYLQAEISKAKAKDDTQLALAIYWRALCQEGRQDSVDAIRDWKTLLSMPPGDMTTQMRLDAQNHLQILVVPSVTPIGGGPSSTPTPFPTNRPGSTATPPLPSETPTP